MAKESSSVDALEEQCTNQIEQSTINKIKLSAACRVTAEQYERDNNYNIASWYYLLAGEYQHNIENISPHIDENFAFSNIAFSLVLGKGKESQVNEYLKKYLTSSPIELSDIALKSDAKTLLHILPQESEKINSLVAKWEALSKELLPIKALLAKLETEDSSTHPAQRIAILLQVLDLQSQRLDKNNISIIKVLLALSDAYIKNKQYPESFARLKQIETNYQLDTQDPQIYVQWLHLMAMNQMKKNDTKKAKHFFNKAVITAEGVFSADSLDLTSIYQDYAKFSEGAGDIGNALIYYEKLLSIYEQRGFLQKLSIIPLEEKLAALYSSINQYPKAVELLKNILSIKQSVLGKDDLETANSKDKLGNEYLKIGEYKKALILFKQALEIKKTKAAKANKASVILAESYVNIANANSSLGNLEQAVISYTKAKTIFSDVVGGNPIKTVKVTNDLASVLSKQNKPQAALKVYLRNLNASEKVYGYNSKELVVVYSHIGDIYSSLNKSQEALKYYDKTLAIQERILGRRHNETALTYNKIGHSQQKLGRYGQAKEYYLKALRVYDKTLGSEHPSVATSFAKIAGLNLKLSNYSQALAYYTKALNIRKKVLGEDKLETGFSTIDLGDFYFTTHHYSKSLDNYKQGLAILEKQAEIKKSLIAKLNNKIGLSYASLGKHKEAIKSYNTSLDLNRAEYGERSIETAVNYFNLGLAYQALDNRTKALELLKKSLAIRVAINGEEQLPVAKTNATIAEIYAQDEAYSNALEFYLRALAVQNKLLGVNHPKTIASYNAIANIYRKKEAYKKSLSFYAKALEAQKKTLTADQIELSDTYKNIAVALLKTDNDEMAYKTIKDSFDIYVRNRYQIFSVLSAQQQKHYIKHNDMKFTLLLEMAEKQIQSLGKSSKSKALLKEIASAWLSYKGAFYDDINKMSEIVKKSTNKHVKSKAAQLQTTRKALLKLYETAPEVKEHKVWSNTIAKYKQRIGILNDAIAKSEEQYQQILDLSKISSHQVSSLLDDEDLYIDFFKSSDNYFILTIDNNETIKLTKLSKGDSEKVDEILKEVHLNAKEFSDKTLKKISKTNKKHLGQLYEKLLLKPLGESLKKKKSLMLSLDGNLKSLPFESLYNNKDKSFLINQTVIRYFTNGKDFIRILGAEKTQVDEK